MHALAGSYLPVVALGDACFSLSFTNRPIITDRILIFIHRNRLCRQRPNVFPPMVPNVILPDSGPLMCNPLTIESAFAKMSIDLHESFKPSSQHSHQSLLEVSGHCTCSLPHDVAIFTNMYNIKEAQGLPLHGFYPVEKKRFPYLVSFKAQAGFAVGIW